MRPALLLAALPFIISTGTLSMEGIRITEPNRAVFGHGCTVVKCKDDKAQWCFDCGGIPVTLFPARSEI